MQNQELALECKQVLKVVLNCGSIRGFDLKHRVKGKDGKPLDASRLTESLHELVERGFITASETFDANSIDMVRFAPLSYGLENSSMCNVEK